MAVRLRDEEPDRIARVGKLVEDFRGGPLRPTFGCVLESTAMHARTLADEGGTCP